MKLLHAFFALPAGLLLAAPVAAQAQATQLPELFRAPSIQVPLRGDEQALAEHNVEVDLALLDAGVLGTLDRFHLDLGDQVHIALLERIDEAWGGGYVWVGGVEGQEDAELHFSVMDEVVTGSIRLHDELYRLAWAERGVHSLSKIDEGRFPPCGVGPEHEVVNPPDPNRYSAARGNCPDVATMVVYTTLARNKVGGTSAMQSKINLGISETNTGYANSGVNQRLVLVHQAELAGYTENGNFNTELSRLRATNDGYIDEVHTWRDSYDADAVSMIVDSGQYCGIAYLMTSVSTSFASSAFNVVSDSCFTGYYSFGHELGHNMGCHHDRGNAGGSSRPYAYGYRTPNNAYRTVLAYSPGTRVNRYSGPSNTWNGNAMGIAYPAANSAENWRALNNNANVVHRWRSEGNPELLVPYLKEGQTVTITGQNLTASGSFGLAYSLAGGGPTASQWGDLCLSVPYPVLAVLPVSGSGTASYSVTAPSGWQGTSVWFQGLDVTAGILTNGIGIVID